MILLGYRNLSKIEHNSGNVYLCFYKDVNFSFGAGGNEYGQCGEEPERKADTGKPVRRDIVIPQRCVPKLSVRQVI